MDDLALNLTWLNDSLSSSLSTTIQDINSNSNLNSASSLSWAEDEVENHATFKVQQCLDNLEDYLLTGQAHGNQKSFDSTEAQFWRDLIIKFKLENRLRESRHYCDKEQEELYPLKKGLVVHGHSTSMYPMSAKFASPTFPHYQLQTPRVRSAHPAKPTAQQTRARSAYPLKSPTLPSLTSRTGVRSGNPSERAHHVKSHQRNSDYYKLVNDTARLEISTNNKSSSPMKGNGIQFRRIKLQPPVLPKLSDLGPESTFLPPLNESKAPLRNNRSKTKPNPIPFITSLKSPSLNNRPSNMDRKPSSAVHHRTLPQTMMKPGHQQAFNRPLYSMPSRSTNGRNEMDLSIELVGTSLSLFEPIARPVRPVVVPKLRTNT